MSRVRLIDAGDAALIAELGPRIDALVNARAVALADALVAERLPGVRDIVPTFTAVTVQFDPLRTDYDRLAATVRRLAAATTHVREAHPREPIDVPVCYGGECGPDLSAVAQAAALSEADVVARHSGQLYRVFMLGFLPGFAYMGPVDAALALPRRLEPRTRVPAGAVAIAGGLTGVYPSASPGGWHVIGRTPLQAFAVDREPAALFRAGDSVRFTPISHDAFEAWPAGAAPA